MEYDVGCKTQIKYAPYASASTLADYAEQVT